MLERLKRHLHPKPATPLEFITNGELTLGVEIELQIIDPATGTLVSRAEEMIDANPDIVKPEFYLSTIEINTGICKDAHAARSDLGKKIDYIKQLAAKMGVAFATTGCHPSARYADSTITPTERYQKLIDRNQWMTRRMTVYGLHVHIGMRDGDECIRFNNFFLNFLPHLLALSASSPFWQGEDTGLASCRPSTYEALPTAGQPYFIKNWQEFNTLYKSLLACGSIHSIKDLWWDLRPSPNYGTLEIRVCDGPATLAEAIAITAYIHALSHWFRDNGEWLEQVAPPPYWVCRENKWRVMRHGLNADMVLGTAGKTKPIRQDIEDWLEKLAPYIETLGYQKEVTLIRDICAKGNSAERQRHVYNTSGIEAVVQHNMKEFSAGEPIFSGTTSKAAA